VFLVNNLGGENWGVKQRIFTQQTDLALISTLSHQYHHPSLWWYGEGGELLLCVLKTSIMSFCLFLRPGGKQAFIRYLFPGNKSIIFQLLG
jgi:hypothetical protein